MKEFRPNKGFAAIVAAIGVGGGALLLDTLLFEKSKGPVIIGWVMVPFVILFSLVYATWVLMYKVRIDEESIETHSLVRKRILWREAKKAYFSGTGAGRKALWVDALEIESARMHLQIPLKPFKKGDRDQLVALVRKNLKSAGIEL